MTAAHTPAHRTWDCTECRQPWPCADRRARFLDDYQGQLRQLRAVLALFFIDATEDLTEPVEQLHERFVGWVPRRGRPARTDPA